MSRKACVLLLLLSLVSLTVLQAQKAFATTDSTGGTAASGLPGGGYAYAFPVTITASGAIQSIGVNWAGTQTGEVRVALYSAGSGKPANLLIQSASMSMSTGAGWQDISVSGYSVTPGSYWIAIQISTGKSIYYGSGLRSYYARSYGSFDSSWSTGSSQDAFVQWNLRVTYAAGPDFTISASPISQNVGAGSTATFTLDLAASGGFSETVSLSVTSGCPSGVACTVTPESVNSFPGSATLSVPTLITTTGTYSVVVTASSTSKTHTVTATVNVQAPASYSFNVRAGAIQIVVTLTYSWSGSGAPPSGSIVIAGPGGSPTLYESGAVVYDRTSIAVSGSTNTYSVIHRVTFTITAPSSAQVWTALVSLSGVSTYNVTIEVS